MWEYILLITVTAVAFSVPVLLSCLVYYLHGKYDNNPDPDWFFFGGLCGIIAAMAFFVAGALALFPQDETQHAISDTAPAPPAMEATANDDEDVSSPNTEDG